MANKCENMLYIIMSSGNCKLQQRDATTHLLEWSEAWTLTTPKPGEDVEHQELSFIPGGNTKWYSCFGGHCGSFI